MVTISDKKLARDTTGDGNSDFYLADIVSTRDYYAFGMEIQERSFDRTGHGVYRYGFNGKEDDDEWGKQDYGFRMYDARVGRFLSVDPLAGSYPWYTPYQFAGNMPIKFIDLDGGEPISNKADANAAIDIFEKDGKATSDWCKTDKSNFVKALRELVADPESLKQTHTDNL
jgi:RHS repeat-associated protein